LVCETVKILRHEAVLEPLEQYDDDDTKVVAALLSVRATEVLQKAKLAEPVQLECEEAALLNKLRSGDDLEHGPTNVLETWIAATRPLAMKRARVARKRPAAAR